MKLVYPQLITGADLLRGIIKLEDLTPILKRRGATAVAIVNSKLYGVRSFYNDMKKNGIHAVIGLSLQLEIAEGKELLLYIYAKDDGGYRNLLKISSASSTREQENLPLSWLKAYSTGCLVVCPMTDISWEENIELSTIEKIKSVCEKDSVFVGISRPEGIIHSREKEIIQVTKDAAITITASHEVRYLLEEDRFAFETAQAIRGGYKLTDSLKEESNFKSAFLPEEDTLANWFSTKPEWLENTSTLLQMCNAIVPASDTLMPVFSLPIGQTAVVTLEEHCMSGLKKRLLTIDDRYLARLRYEIDVISKMGFEDYFLIVEDFINYSRDNGILTGPGRGSSAGSLVAFALGITDVDPIKYELIFERFLNPDRVTLPDIDIDFADNRRMEVIQYVAQKYGKSKVAQIITFGSLSARSVARNVARVFDFSNEEIAYVSKIIPAKTGITLEQALQESKKLREWIAIDPVRQQWFDTSIKLEGLPRNASTHAAGLILSPIPLVETVPLQEGSEGIYLTQWPMGEVEEQGLLKMDFLGLRNLTLLDKIKSSLKYDKGINLDFEKIPLDDEKTFELFRSGEMTGIFQFESAGMRDALRMIKPSNFEDIFAITALYRPGPMDNIPVYSRRKNENEPISYTHPLLETVLKETYGVIIYQEQIMKIAVDVAGFTMAEADLLRRAISKKKRDIIEKERLHFTRSAEQNGFPLEAATEVYDLIVKFADYGFPKSHAVAYSLISYRLAYLKTNEPAYFYAALLSTTMGNHEKTFEILREAQTRGVQVLPPSLKSKFSYSVEKGSIRIGLSAIKGISFNFYKAIKEQRANGVTWKSLFDMAVSLGSDVFTEKSIQPLIKAGALDSFGQPRAVLLASIEAAISHALFIRPDEGEDLLSDILHSVANPKYSPGGTMPRMTLLEYEKEVLGFYLSDHPAAELKKSLEEHVDSVYEISSMKDNTNVTVVGLIIETKRIRTKKGESMAFVTLQDETGQIACTFFPKQYALANSHLIDLTMIQVQGKMERRNGSPQVLIQQSKPM